jgi:hypothetical protein
MDSSRLGNSPSDHGAFDVFAVTDDEHKVRIVFLSQHRPVFGSWSAFHEKVIVADLAGQREFSWGKVLCGEQLIIAYSGGLHVPLHDEPILDRLFAHEADPFESASETSGAICEIGPPQLRPKPD